MEICEDAVSGLISQEPDLGLALLALRLTGQCGGWQGCLRISVCGQLSSHASEARFRNRQEGGGAHAILERDSLTSGSRAELKGSMARSSISSPDHVCAMLALPSASQCGTSARPTRDEIEHSALFDSLRKRFAMLCNQRHIPLE